MTSSLFNQYQSVRKNFVPGGLFGDQEPFLQGYRSAQPLDLNAERWCREHPEGSFAEWQQQAKTFALECLRYNPGPVELRPEVLEVEQRDGYRAEKVAFHTAPWCRVEAWFLCPDGNGPFPAVVALHSWGGQRLLGKDRLVSRGKTHPRLAAMLDEIYSGRFFAEDLARRGYAVVVIDAFHFGRRLPWGAKILQKPDVNWLPPYSDPLDMDEQTFDELNHKATELIFSSSMKYLFWAGTTWAGVNFWDDSRSVDYLLSRPEVDGSRIGCVGNSGGGWRTNLLAALDDRITASVSSCWMTTGHWQHIYNLTGTLGPYTMIPGLWQRMDLPDFGVLAAPRHAMVILGQDDQLFAPEAMAEAARQIQAGFEWAGVPDHFHFHYPAKPHAFDQENQNIAWAWFDRWLRP